jgi:hypothetical protein
MKQRIRILVEYILAIMVVVLLVIAIAGVVVVKFYGDDLQDFVMQEVNERLDAKVDVKDVSVRVFHKFPNTSIVLREVTVWSSHNFNVHDFAGEGADTLLTAENVSVSFNLPGVIRKRFNVRQLEIRNGSLHLYTDSSGEVNFKLSEKKGHREGGKGLINISNFRVIGFNIHLNNQAKKLLASGWLDRLDLSGKVSSRDTQIRGSLEGSLEEISNKGILYASKRKVGVKMNLDVQDSVYTIRSGHLQVDRILADVDGRFQVHAVKGIEMNLIAAARDLEIHEVLDLLPNELTDQLKEIRGNGILQLYARVTGVASSTLTPHIEADFQTSNANLSWEKVPFSLKNLNLTGSYSNGGEFSPVTTFLKIESISTDIGADHLSGRGQVRNFLEPDFSFELKGDIHPEQWISWYDSLPLEKVTGTIIPDIKVAGSYDRHQPRGKKFLAFDLSGGIALEDILILFTKQGIPVRHLNGAIHIDNDFWEPAFSGTFGNSDFAIKGTGLNLLSSLIDKDENLIVSAIFRSDHLDLQEVLDQLPHKMGPEENSFVRFPEKLNVKLDFSVHDFVKERFAASNVRGIAQYDAPFLYIDSLTMQTMEGTLRGSFGLVQDAEGNIHNHVDAGLYHLNIRELFEAFNNFGQKEVTYEQLKGSISGTSVFTADFDPAFSIRPESILSENNITIHHGELNGVPSIMALSRFIEVEELRNIRFETLENTILIRDSQVIIPVMDIRSNALNLTASGIHDFENHYDYRVKLRLSELLYSKVRGSRKAEFEVAEDEADTRTLFLKIFDNGSGVTVELDREKTAQKIRDDLKNEKSELKMILNEELGLFKRDGQDTLEKEKKDKAEDVFRFEFSDEPDTGSAGTPTKEKKRWWEKRAKSDTIKNKPAREFVIDE